jgi:hypothetical protein
MTSTRALTWSILLLAMAASGCGGAGDPAPDPPGADEPRAELPESWPADAALPPGATIATSSRSEGTTGCDLAVTASIAGEHVPDVDQHFAARLDDWKRVRASQSGAGDTRLVNRAWTRDGDRLQMTASVQTGRTVIALAASVPC